MIARGKVITRWGLFLASAGLAQIALSQRYDAPENLMPENPLELFSEDFTSGVKGDFYEQNPGEGVWSVIQGELVSESSGGFSALIAPEISGRAYINRSIFCNVKVTHAEQVGMVALGYRIDMIGNAYFLCAGIYKGRWAIGYYPNEDTGAFALIKSYDYGPDYTTWRKPLLNQSYQLRLDVESDAIRLFVDDFPLPYLQIKFDTMPVSGGVGFVSGYHNGGSVTFDDFRITELVREAGQISAFPFTETFDDPTSFEGMAFSNPQSWYIENGSLVLDDPDDKCSFAFWEQVTGENWEIEGDVTLGTSDSRAGFVFSIRGITGYLSAFIRHSPVANSSYLYLGSASHWANDIDMGHHTYVPTFALNTPHHLKVRCDNGSITFTVDDIYSRTCADYANDLLPSSEPYQGFVGLKNYSTQDDGYAKFDNITVTPLVSEEWVPSNKDLILTEPEFSDDLDFNILEHILSQYEHSPERLYEYIANEIAYKPAWLSENASYWTTGSDHTAAGVLWSGVGTDLEQSSALIALLRSCGIHCRYVRGSISVKAGDWSDLIGQKLKFNDGRPIPDENILTPNNRIWVQAYVNGKTIDLFPWFKTTSTANDACYSLNDVLREPTPQHPEWFGTWDAPSDEPIAMELVRRCIYKDSDLYPLDANGRLLYGTDQPLDALQRFLRDKLENEGAYKHAGQIGVLRRINPCYISSLSTATPDQIIRAVPVELDNGLFGESEENGPLFRTKVRVSISDESGNGLYEEDFSTYELFNKRLTLCFNNPVPLAQLTKNHRALPVVRLEGEQRGLWLNNRPLYGTSSSDHNYLILEVKVYNPVLKTWDDPGSPHWSQRVAVGQDVSIINQINPVSGDMLDYRLARYLETLSLLPDNSYPQEPSNVLYEPVVGNLLSYIGLKYCQCRQNESSRFSEVGYVKHFDMGLSSRGFERGAGYYHPGYLSIDMRYLSGNWNAVDDDRNLFPMEAERNFKILSLLSGSAYEHGVFWDVMKSKDVGSSIKYLQMAIEQGGTVLEISKDYFDANRSSVQNFLSVTESDFGQALDIFSDLDAFFDETPDGLVWVPSKSVTNKICRALGWLIVCDGYDAETGNPKNSAYSGAFIKTKYEPQDD